MAGFTVLSRTSSTIVVEDYRATIAIPMAAKLLIPKVQDIAAAEEFFTRKKRNESNHGKRVDFDRARALSKWGKDCNGILCEMGKRQSKLYVLPSSHLSIYCTGLSIHTEIEQWILPSIFIVRVGNDFLVHP